MLSRRFTAWGRHGFVAPRRVFTSPPGKVFTVDATRSPADDWRAGRRARPFWIGRSSAPEGRRPIAGGVNPWDSKANGSFLSEEPRRGDGRLIAGGASAAPSGPAERWAQRLASPGVHTPGYWPPPLRGLRTPPRVGHSDLWSCINRENLPGGRGENAPRNKSVTPPRGETPTQHRLFISTASPSQGLGTQISGHDATRSAPPFSRSARPLCSESMGGSLCRPEGRKHCGCENMPTLASGRLAPGFEKIARIGDGSSAAWLLTKARRCRRRG